MEARRPVELLAVAAVSIMPTTLPRHLKPNHTGAIMSADLSLLQTAGVAVILGVKPQTLRKWRLQGRGPRYIRLGGPTGRVAYRRSDIDSWLDARTFESTAAETVTRG